MTMHWKTLIFLSAAGILSISTLPVRAGCAAPCEGEKTVVIQLEDPGAGEDGEDITFALGDPDGKVRKEKRIVIRTDGEDHPRLGVVLRFEKSSKTDTKGAYVQGVTPGSPADEAGVVVGDIIVKFNGQDLTAAARGDEDLSAPAERLVQLARKLGEGEKVALEILRGSKTINLDVVARKLEGNSVFTWTGDGEELDIEKLIPGDFPAFHLNFCGEGWLDMELVSLDSDLGDYFGTTDGLLVVKAPEDPSLGIKAGDVLQKIGTRKPTTPAQAFRILSSYEAGESVDMEVLRKQRPQTLQFKVPESGKEAPGGIHRVRVPAPHPPPAPPVKEVRRG